MDPIGIKYSNNYITVVIFRLDIGSRFENNKLAEVSNDIFPELPLYEATNRVANVLDIQNKGAEVAQINIQEHAFFNRDRTIKFVIENNAIYLEVKKYVDFNSFKRVVDSVVGAFLRYYPLTFFTRLGLRYVNEIAIREGNAFEWNDYISKNLTNAIDGFVEDKENISRAMSQLFFNYDDHHMSFQYGIFNTSFPARIGRKEFVLDFDCYTNDVENARIGEIVVKFNERITNLFEKSITEGLRNTMNPIKI